MPAHASKTGPKTYIPLDFNILFEAALARQSISIPCEDPYCMVGPMVESSLLQIICSSAHEHLHLGM